MPRGCSICREGAKLVLFVTGVCDSSCFYCPLSAERAGLDVVFADEMPVLDESDILIEARSIDAKGAGLSGGDPLCRLDRTVRYIRLLKEDMGNDFHVHLYTARTYLDNSDIDRLVGAGLDEIRFHPQRDDWSGVKRAVDAGLETGLEVPAIPGRLDNLKRVAEKGEKVGVSFLNINELEASETNFGTLRSMGMVLASMDGASIRGSIDVARELIQWAAAELGLSVHFCSASFKDGVQMKRRLLRRLENTIREFEIQQEDEPILVLGIIRAPHGRLLSNEDLSRIRNILTTRFEVPDELVCIDLQRNRIETAAWILEEIAHDLKRVLGHEEQVEIGVAREYPTWDRLQVEFEPL
ncbi:MAG: radical SAM protein [Candidatus Thorarchaeota archaeon]